MGDEKYMRTIIQFLADERQTICLAFLLLLSLVLPLMAGGAHRAGTTNFKPLMRTVWTGQLLAASSGFPIIIWPQYSGVGLGLAVVVYAVFGFKLRQQIQTTLTANNL